VPVPTVFISYASEDADWKSNFTFKEWFGQNLGNVLIRDYQMAGNLPYGSINNWLQKEVGAAGAIIVIVSEHYIEKKYTLKEWWLALSEVERRRLIFVPVMIHADAKNWWAEQKRQGTLRDLGGDYAYSDFTDGSGRRTPIVGDRGLAIDTVTQRIMQLALLIRDNLGHQEVPPNAPSAGDQARPVTEPAITSAPSTREPPASVSKSAIVVLGHANAVAGPEVAENRTQLIGALQSVSLEPIAWGNGWQGVPSARQGSGALPQNTIFIQPLGPGEAGLFATNPAVLRKWLDAAVRADRPQGAVALSSYTLVLWLPKDLKDDDFESALKGAKPGENLVLRHDDAYGLAVWMNTEITGAVHAGAALIILEEVPEDRALRPSDKNQSARLRAALHDGFYKIIEEELNQPPKRWFFSGDMLEDQLKVLDTDRVIIAIHDLNTGTARERHEAQRELEQKLSAIEDATRIAGQRGLKFFRSALLVAKADQFPWVKYESPSRFERWCLLRFIEEEGNSLQPRATEASLFRAFLRTWARDAA
jgi:hypothetical protein